MDRQAFLDRAARYQRDGWRLAIINATSVLPTEGLERGAFDITWSFARGREFEHIAERVLPGEEVPSVSRLFGGAFLFENEIRELFGVNLTGIGLDLRGQLYRTAERVPFSPAAIRARLEAAGRAEATKHVAPKADGASVARAEGACVANAEGASVAGSAGSRAPASEPPTAAGPPAPRTEPPAKARLIDIPRAPARLENHA